MEREWRKEGREREKGMEEGRKGRENHFEENISNQLVIIPYFSSLFNGVIKSLTDWQ